MLLMGWLNKGHMMDTAIVEIMGGTIAERGEFARTVANATRLRAVVLHGGHVPSTFNASADTRAVYAAAMLVDSVHAIQRLNTYDVAILYDDIPGSSSKVCSVVDEMKRFVRGFVKTRMRIDGEGDNGELNVSGTPGIAAQVVDKLFG